MKNFSLTYNFLKTYRQLIIWFLISIIFLPEGVVFAQNPQIQKVNFRVDSLEKKLTQTKNLNKLLILNQLAKEVRAIDLQKSLVYGKEALQLATQLGQTEGKAEALENLGMTYVSLTQYEDALFNLDQSLRHFRIGQNNARLAQVLNRIGTTHYRVGNYAEALRNLLDAKEKYQKLDDKLGSSKVLSNLGLVYKEQGKFEQAELSYLDALQLSQRLNRQSEIGSQLNNLGLLYASQKKYEQALNKYQEALSIQNKLGDSKEIAYLYNNIAETYEAQNFFEQALDYYQKSLDLKQTNNDREGLATAYINIARLYKKTNEPQKALEYAQKGLKLAEDISAKPLLKDISLVLAELYANEPDYPKSLQYYRLHLAMKDSLYNKERIELAEKIAAQITLKGEKLRNKDLLSENEKMLAEAEKQQGRYYVIRNSTWILGLIALLVCVLLVFMYRAINQRKKVNLQLEKTLSERNDHLEKLNQQLTKTNLELDNFLYKVSHDFKGPLSTLEGLTNLGMMDAKDESSARYFEMQKKVIISTQLLIFRIVEIGDIRHHTYKSSVIKMKRFMRQMVRSMSRAEEGGHDIQFEVDVPEEMEINTDVEMLEIALDNIIKNAIQHAKYFNEDGTAKVSIFAKDLEAYHQISIIDNGHGISADIADRIFDMFFRGNNHFKGFGLGLYKSKIAIEKINGEINLSKTSLNETIFTIRIPRHKLSNENSANISI
jgi:tetratricopeptide (TPR) repeat protein